MKWFTLLIIFFSSQLLSKTIDFGEVGVLYDIKEVNLQDIVDQGIKDLNTTKIKKKMYESVNKAFYSKVDFNDSLEENTVKYIDYYIVPYDVINPQNGEVLYYKGDKIKTPLPIGVKMDLCFIDGSDDKEVLEEIFSNFGKCVYFVNNIDTREIEKRYPLYNFFPIGGQNLIYKQRFNIDVVPTKISKENDVITKRTLNIEMIREKYRSQNAK